MIEFDPTKRITMAKIKEHPFLKGATVTSMELAKEFNEYKQVIQEMLEKDKKEK